MSGTRRSTPRRQCAGLTLIEVLITVAILGGLFASLVGILKQTNGAFQASSSFMQLETRGTRLLRQITRALRAADTGSLSPVVNPPFSSATLQFRTSEGFDGTDTSWSTLRQIGFDPATGQVIWTDDLGSADETQSIWTQAASPRLEGEAANGADDNGNGLLDEGGLCFTFEDDVLVVRFTLAAEQPGGRRIERTWMTRLDCRN